jgi:hypothetical protein
MIFGSARVKAFMDVFRQSGYGDFSCAEQLKSVDLYGGGPIGAGAGDRVCRSKCTAIIREKYGPSGLSTGT